MRNCRKLQPYHQGSDKLSSVHVPLSKSCFCQSYTLYACNSWAFWHSTVIKTCLSRTAPSWPNRFRVASWRTLPHVMSISVYSSDFDIWLNSVLWSVSVSQRQVSLWMGARRRETQTKENPDPHDSAKDGPWCMMDGGDHCGRHSMVNLTYILTFNWPFKRWSVIINVNK